MYKPFSMSRLLIFFSVLMFVSWGASTIRNRVRYHRIVGEHLQLAAQATSIDLAEHQLDLAVHGMTTLGLCTPPATRCSTSLLLETPGDDLHFWRANIESALRGMRKMTEAERQDSLHASTKLLHLQRSVAAGTPPGVAMYPKNRLYAGWLTISGLLLFSGGVLGIRSILSFEER